MSSSASSPASGAAVSSADVVLAAEDAAAGPLTYTAAEATWHRLFALSQQHGVNHIILPALLPPLDPYKVQLLQLTADQRAQLQLVLRTHIVDEYASVFSRQLRPEACTRKLVYLWADLTYLGCSAVATAVHVRMQESGCNLSHPFNWSSLSATKTDEQLYSDVENLVPAGDKRNKLDQAITRLALIYFVDECLHPAAVPATQKANDEAHHHPHHQGCC